MLIKLFCRMFDAEKFKFSYFFLNLNVGNDGKKNCVKIVKIKGV